MFCTKCGAEIAEGSKFCIRCGTPVDNAAAKAKFEESTANPGPTVLPPAAALHKPNIKKLLVPGVFVLGIIIAVIFVFFRGPKTGFRSPEEAFEVYNNGVCSHDFDRAIEACPDFYIAYNGGEDGMRAFLESVYNNLYANSLGAFQYTYKTIGHTNLSEEARETLQHNINAAFNAEVKITDAAEIIFEFSAKYLSDGHEESMADASGGTSFTSGYAVRCQGKWYYFPAY